MEDLPPISRDCTNLANLVGMLISNTSSPCKAMRIIGYCSAFRILLRLGKSVPSGLLAAAITSPKRGSSLRDPNVEDRGDLSPELWGEKVFVTNGLDADNYVVYGSRRGKPAVFLVERGSENLLVEPMRLTVYQCSGISRLLLRGVLAVLVAEGEEARGAVVRGLADSRVLVAALAIGLGRKALGLAVSWAKRRGVLGKQAVSHRLAAAAVGLEAALALVEKTAQRIDEGVSELWESSAAKYAAVEAALAAVKAARRTLGGYAYSEDDMGRTLRSLELHIEGLEPAEGTQDIQLEIVSRSYFSATE